MPKRSSIERVRLQDDARIASESSGEQTRLSADAFERASARSISSVVSAALICTRMRAVPSGTTGKPKPVTKTPSFSSLSLIAIANAVSPTMIGTIALSLSSGL